MAVAVFAGGKPASVERNKDDDGEERVNVRITSPIVAIMIDAGDEIANIQVLLKRMDEAIANNTEHLEKSLDRLTLHSYQNNDRADQQFAYFIDGGNMVACTNIAYIEDLAQVWSARGRSTNRQLDKRKYLLR